MAHSGRELSPKVTEGDCGQQHSGQHRAKTATRHPGHSGTRAHCVKALWHPLQAPSDPAYAGPPPSLREALGWQASGGRPSAAGTPHLLE